MDSKSTSSSSTTSSRQTRKRKDAPDSTDSANKKRCTIIDCPVASGIFQELGCTKDFLNSGKVLARALDSKDPAFQNIHTYVARSPPYRTVKVLSILEIMTSANSLQNGAIPSDHGDDPKNKSQLRKMGWHGTPSKNVLSILQNGLKVPKRKYPDPWLGDGIYFSDKFSYSLGYCRGFSKDKKGRLVAYLFLSDVLLGNIYKTYKLQPKAPMVQISKPKPQGGGLETVTMTVESIQGCGTTTPDPKEDDSRLYLAFREDN